MSAPSCHSSFELLRVQPVASLDIEVAEYRHRKTGALHYHIVAEQEENVFLVAFRTLPQDSTGVAHILEHTALCGSEKYPVRDPFFMMTRRSLNTFMNAFTSSDWTAYPFASQNPKDFFNLLDVYLDAAFFSRLDPLDFAQEGHRIEFAEPENPDSPLVFKGVVFNEMKGAMSSPVATLWQTVTRYLFPSTTYHFNSGGEPDCIPDLSYQQLQAFYQQHYHPSNAVFMTFGNLPAEQLQARMDSQALQRFERQTQQIEVADEKRYLAPLYVEEAYALDETDSQAKTHLVMAWLLGSSIDLKSQLKAHLLSRVLLDNSASPLRQALESSDLAAAPSPLCGLEDSNRQLSFMCGLEGSEPEHAAAFEQLVLTTLTQVAEQGVPQAMVQAQLHQLELEQREISGDGYPYGLSLILASLPSAIHRGDPVALLNLDPVLEALRKESQAEDFIPNLVRDWLLDNQHRVRVTLRPDAQLSGRKERAEQARLAAIRQTLDEAGVQQVLAQTAALQARQNQQDDESLLPKVTLQDVPAHLQIAHSQPGLLNNQPLDWYSQGTNGLVYQQVVMPLPALTEQEQQLLPLYATCLTSLGCGARTYRENQQYQAQVSGGINAFTSIRGAIDDEQKAHSYFVLSGKALLSNAAALSELLLHTLEQVRFDEHDYMRELVAQKRSRKEQSITGQGHTLAVMAAAAELSPVAHWQQLTQGLTAIVFLKQLDKQLDDPAKLAELAQQLQQIHSKIAAAPRRFLLIGEPEQQANVQQAVQPHWPAPSSSAGPLLQLAPTRQSVKQIWSVNTQVNFCARVYPTVTVEHPDAAALTVLGGFLRNGYLHRAIREQGGAYGAGASQNSGDALFSFYSYRDPRLEQTLADFDQALVWLQQNDHTPQRLEEAILGVISSIDKPASPAGEAKSAYHNALLGRSAEQRQAFRQQILAVTLADLQRVARQYFAPEQASTAVITGATKAQALADQYQVLTL